jgi:glycosyltransferase involved in cell wall biosynthesis
LSAKTTIIHVVPTLGAGGTEQNCARLVKAFQETGELENVIIANRPGDERFREVFEGLSDYQVILLTSGRSARLQQFRKVIRKRKPEAVLFHFLNIDQVLMALTARMVGVSRIVSSAGSAALGDRGYLLKLRIILMGNLFLSCPVVSASNWISTTHKRLMRFPKGSVVVHNGVDIKRFTKTNVNRHRSRKLGEPWKIGMVSRLDGVKEHDVLIRGFIKFLSDVPEANAEFWIIGDGPKREALENLVFDLGATDRVFFLKNRLDIPEQLNALDAFVFATKQKEGFGNVLIEALAAGVPVIANDVPSSIEVLRGGKFGTLVPSTGPEAWAHALECHWRDGPAMPPPTAEEVEAAYGIKQFRDGYLAVLGLTAAISERS